MRSSDPRVRPVNCKHVYVARVPFQTGSLGCECQCMRCNHTWEEHPIQMTRDEFELWMVILDLYLPRSVDIP